MVVLKKKERVSMTEKRKRKAHLLSVLILVFCFVSMSGINYDLTADSAELQPTAITKTQALNWAKGHADKRTPFDVDGIYGVQCADFGTAYTNYIISKDSSLNHPYSTFNGSMYYEKINRNGWKKIRYKEGFVPEPGDILVWDENIGNGAGHVAVAIEGCSTSRIKCIDQSGSAQEPTQYSTFNYSHFYGVVRPLWKDETCRCVTKYAGEYVTTCNLNMRNGHGTDYRKIDLIPEGAKVHVSKSDGTWAHVSYDGQDGYCSMKYLKKYVKPGTSAEYRLDVWYSDSPMGDRIEGPVFSEEIYYLCYELTDRNTGKPAGGSYKVKLSMSSSDETLEETTYSSKSRGSLKCKAGEEKTYKGTVSVSGGIITDRILELPVYNRTEPEVLVDVTDEPMVGNKAEVTFNIRDKLTGKRVNTVTDYWKSRDDYYVDVRIADPEGNTVMKKKFISADYGTLTFDVLDVGEYTAVVTPHFLPEPFKQTVFARAREELTASHISMNRYFTPYSGGFKTPYSGKHINAVPIVKNSRGDLLEEGTDYEVSYSDEERRKIGLYSVNITGKGDYTGSVDRNIAVVPAAPSEMTSRLTTASGGYDDIYTMWSDVPGADGYNLYYRRNDGDGDWKYIGKMEENSYLRKDLSDGYTYEYKVVPYFYHNGTRYLSTEYKTSSATTLKKVQLTGVSRYSSSQVKVSWKNIRGERGYQISQSTSKSKDNIVYTMKTTSATHKEIKAKENKSYYYKVRAYVHIEKGGKTYKVYGPWSSVKKYAL